MDTSLYIFRTFLEHFFMQISNFQTVLKSDIDFSKYARFDMGGGENRRTLIFWVFL